MSLLNTGLLIIQLIGLFGSWVFAALCWDGVKEGVHKQEKEWKQKAFDAQDALINARRDHRNRIEELTTTNSRLIRENKDYARENAHLIVERDNARDEIEELKGKIEILSEELIKAKRVINKSKR